MKKTQTKTERSHKSSLFGAIGGLTAATVLVATGAVVSSATNKETTPPPLVDDEDIIITDDCEGEYALGDSPIYAIPDSTSNSSTVVKTYEYTAAIDYSHDPDDPNNQQKATDTFSIAFKKSAIAFAFSITAEDELVELIEKNQDELGYIPFIDAYNQGLVRDCFIAMKDSAGQFATFNYNCTVVGSKTGTSNFTLNSATCSGLPVSLGQNQFKWQQSHRVQGIDNDNAMNITLSLDSGIIEHALIKRNSKLHCFELAFDKTINASIVANGIVNNYNPWSTINHDIQQLNNVSFENQNNFITEVATPSSDNFLPTVRAYSVGEIKVTNDRGSYTSSFSVGSNQSLKLNVLEVNKPYIIQVNDILGNPMANETNSGPTNLQALWNKELTLQCGAVTARGNAWGDYDVGDFERALSAEEINNLNIKINKVFDSNMNIIGYEIYSPDLSNVYHETSPGLLIGDPSKTRHWRYSRLDIVINIVDKFFQTAIDNFDIIVS